MSGEGLRVRDRLGRIYTYYSAAALAESLVEAGLIQQRQSTGRDTGLDGQLVDWAAILCKHG